MKKKRLSEEGMSQKLLKLPMVSVPWVSQGVTVHGPAAMHANGPLGHVARGFPARTRLARTPCHCEAA